MTKKYTIKELIMLVEKWKATLDHSKDEWWGYVDVMSSQCAIEFFEWLEANPDIKIDTGPKITFSAWSNANKSWAEMTQDKWGEKHYSSVSQKSGWPRPGYKSVQAAKSKISSNKRDNEWEWEIQEWHDDLLVNSTPLDFK